MSASSSAASPVLPQLRVQHVVTSIVPELLPVQGYHSSVLIGDLEYTFSRDGGVVVSEGPESHEGLEAETTFIDLGVWPVDLEAFEAAILPLFEEGSYDLLRKNCNSFTDSAISFLTGGRMDSKYRQLESIGKVADQYTNVVRVLSGGAYEPNELADDFDLERAVRAMLRARRRAARAARPAEREARVVRVRRVPCVVAAPVYLRLPSLPRVVVTV